VPNGAVAMGEAPVLLREDPNSLYLRCVRYLCKSDPTASRASLMCRVRLGRQVLPSPPPLPDMPHIIDTMFAVPAPPPADEPPPTFILIPRFTIPIAT
jgi:hypothetical protein